MATRRGTDHYATLGVGRDAKPEAIRKAYRHLARKLHPDVNPGDAAAEERFKRVQEAYNVLGDEKKREFYDRHGFYSEQAQAAGPSRGARRGGFGFEGFDFGDVARGAGPDVESMFESFLGGGRRRKTAPEEPRKGEDLDYELEIGFFDAIRGTTVTLSVERMARCAPCGGSGSALGASPRQCTRCGGAGSTQAAMGNMQFQVPCASCGGTGRSRTPCPRCRGDGRVRKKGTVEARIPPGTGENSRLRLPGKGNAGLRGGSAGDLYIVARIGRHPFFERKGFDIHIEVPVTPAEAVLGGKVEVPTIDGTAVMRIPPATSSGRTFRHRERGVVDPRSGRRGHQFVKILIVVPEIPDEATKELMRRYSELNPENPRSPILDASAQ